MPLAKSAVVTEQPKVTITQNPPDSISRMDIAGVPVSVYEYFSAPLNLEEKEVNKLKTITDWAKVSVPKDATEGDLLLLIRNLETYLGSPDGLQKRYDKLFNYCKMDLYSKELDKKKEALRRRF
jgi:hypothetical protein